MRSKGKQTRTTRLAIFQIAVATLAVSSALSAAGDVWKTKPYTQWDEKDVSAVLHTSPWVKLNLSDLSSGQLSPTPPDVGGALDSSAPTPGRTNPATATVAPAPDNTDAPAPSAGTANKTYNVFWWSARTIREALARQAVLKHETTAEAAEKAVSATPESYQVLVSTPNMVTLEAHGADALKDGAFIELKKAKKKIKPSDVIFERAGGKLIGAIFSFPKKDASGAPVIDPDEKQIDFNVRAPGIWLRATFNVKQMSDAQGPDI
jgi:hypothetical protein